jgi:3-hydroxypropanoate dehydrogenase
VKQALPDSCLDQLFREARTYHGWTDRAVDDELLSHLYELVKLGPTSANTCPARFVWVRSRDGAVRVSAAVKTIAGAGKGSRSAGACIVVSF